MSADQRPAGPSPLLTQAVTGIEVSLRAVAAVPSDDPSDPVIGYYAAELSNLRAAMLPRTGQGGL